MNNSASASLLLVEDNSGDRGLTLRAFQKANFSGQIHVCEDGEEALDYLFCHGKFAERNIRECPKLILLDLKLPKVNGLEVLEKIKSDPRTCNIPVVMFTSSRQRNDVLTSQLLGVNSYVVKPVSSSAFSETVQQLCAYWMTLNEPSQQLTSSASQTG